MELGFIILCGIAGAWFWTVLQTRKAVREYLHYKLMQRGDLTKEEVDLYVRTVGFKEAEARAAEMKAKTIPQGGE